MGQRGNMCHLVVSPVTHVAGKFFCNNALLVLFWLPQLQLEIVHRSTTVPLTFSEHKQYECISGFAEALAANTPRLGGLFAKSLREKNQCQFQKYRLNMKLEPIGLASSTSTAQTLTYYNVSCLVNLVKN